jgi:hypothetical protein
LTNNEQFLLDVVLYAGFGLTAIYLWIGVQETHGFGFIATLKCIIVTFLFVVVAVVVIFNAMVLFQQIVNFVESLIREVYVNVMGLY